MKKIWKEVVILCCFVSIYSFLIFEHEQHMHGVVVKEIPYITLLIVTVIFILWGIDKIKQYQTGSVINDKLRRLSEQYNLDYDETKPTSTNESQMLDQIMQMLKRNELNISSFEYRYRLIANITNQVIFEYNLKNHTICDSKNWKTLADGNRFVNESISREIIHPDDAQLFRQYFDDYQISGQINEIIIRVRYHEDDIYHRTKIRGIVLEGLDGQPEKIIGARIQLDDTNNDKHKGKM